MQLWQVLLVAEREENDVTKKAHANAQERNKELNKKVEDADEATKQLTDIVKRFAVLLDYLSFSILYLLDCSEVLFCSQLVEVSLLFRFRSGDCHKIYFIVLITFSYIKLSF